VSRSSILSELYQNFKPLNVFFTKQCTSPRRNWVRSGLVLIHRSALTSTESRLSGGNLARALFGPFGPVIGARSPRPDHTLLLTG
jgi:hypothetical protein